MNKILAENKLKAIRKLCCQWDYPSELANKILDILDDPKEIFITTGICNDTTVGFHRSALRCRGTAHNNERPDISKIKFDDFEK